MSGPAAAAGASKFQAFMNHPAGLSSAHTCFFLRDLFCVEGPKTVFFWAPLMKWCLVGAGLKDLSRPADKLSISQNLGESQCKRLFSIENSTMIALATTGFIWVRYSVVIIPVNYSLAAVCRILSTLCHRGGRLKLFLGQLLCGSIRSYSVGANCSVCNLLHDK